MVLYSYLPLGILDWGNGRICLDGVSPTHVANGSEEQGNTHFRATMSKATVVVWLVASAGLGLGLLGSGVLR